MKSLIYLLLITILLSCNSKDEVISSTAGDQDIVKLNVEVDEFTMLASSGRILRQSAQQDREAITSLMRTLRSALTLLNINPSDTNALRTVEVTLLELRSYKVSERDIPRLTGMYRQANNILNKYSKLQGVEVSFKGDLLYQFDLADGTEENDVYPFGNVIEEGGGLWRRAESLDRYLVKTSGTNGTSWLISPQFDFTNVEKPGLRIRQTINIGENSSVAFNFQAIYNNVYQILVSEDYDKGSPDSGTWKVFDAPGIKPSGKDFHTVDSGVVSLSKYKGKKVTLALKYSGGDAGGRHYLSWQIDRFEVSGVTDKFNYKPYEKEVEILPVFRVDFSELGQSSLDKFTQETISGDPGEFYVGEHQGNNYVRINKKNGLGVRRMYSESLTNFKELIKPAISIFHNVKFYEVKDQSKKLLKLFIAKDEQGVSVQDLKWIDLDINMENTGNSYNKVNSNWFLFPSELIGENVRISLQWEGDGTIAPLWDIHQINIDEREGQE
jgi:hypothetical protein